MAATTTTPEQPVLTPWVRYYRTLAQEPGPYHDLDERDLSYLDNMSSGYLENESRFMLDVANSDGINFILLPEGRGYVRLFHQCITHRANLPGREPVVVGLFGSRATSPFRQIQTAAAVMKMNVPATRTATEGRIPGPEAFLGVETATDFSSLTGHAGAEDEPGDPAVSTLASRPGTFWMHPYLYRELRGVDRAKASELATRIITIVKSLQEDADDDNTLAEQVHQLLIYLWAVDRGYAPVVSLLDLPNSTSLDNRCQEISAAVLPSPAPVAPVPATTTPAAAIASGTGDSDLQKALIQNLTTMTESALAAQERDERKKSMKSRLSPEAEALFSLLCASGWRDYTPTMPQFTEKLLADKDLNKALGILRAFTAKWKGSVSEKGFAKFLSTGYSAPDIEDRPGGFTLFMFRPLHRRRTRTAKELRNDVRSMFGEETLDDEMVKYFSSDDFYLPKDLYELDDMLSTCVQLLSSLTAERGIAVEGYEYGLSLIRRDRRVFLSWLQNDKLLPVKFGFLLDKAFQNFVADFSEHVSETNPIRAARHAGLQRSMTDEIRTALGGFRSGAMPNLVLPSSLTGGTGPDEAATSGPATGTSTGGDVKQEATQSARWWSVNPAPVQEWSIPKGKTYGDFFDPRVEELKKNSKGWPSLPHHKSGQEKPLCMKYQVKGSCRAKCPLAHVRPNEIDIKVKDEITVRCQEIFKA